MMSFAEAVKVVKNQPETAFSDIPDEEIQKEFTFRYNAFNVFHADLIIKRSDYVLKTRSAWLNSFNNTLEAHNQKEFQPCLAKFGGTGNKILSFGMRPEDFVRLLYINHIAGFVSDPGMVMTNVMDEGSIKFFCEICLKNDPKKMSAFFKSEALKFWKDVLDLKNGPLKDQLPKIVNAPSDIPSEEAFYMSQKLHKFVAQLLLVETKVRLISHCSKAFLEGLGPVGSEIDSFLNAYDLKDKLYHTTFKFLCLFYVKTPNLT
jgi:hypothetical protein